MLANLFRRGGGRRQGSDSKYFSSSGRGELKELATALASSNVEEMKEAVKKVIAAMTVNKDMSSLVPSVVNCMRTDNLEVKKLVYLYLINYAKSNPDMTLMAVNAFVKDTKNMNPLVRALAIRTMGCIRVERITEHLASPLRKALADEDPYVRKTAAMGVAKLYDIDPALTREQGFLEILLDLTSDPVPIVVANAVAALMEVQDTTTHDVFAINTATLTRLLAALKDCSEWGQVVILDALSTYVPADEREAETVIERIAPWLAHQNPAVVLNSVKAIVLLLESVDTAATTTAVLRKLGPPLVTLAQSSHPEIQYVALRNISLVVQRFPGLLSSKVRVFFCKYNEPIYVKMEKLEVLVRLANASNVDSVLMELREYAQEVDVEYVRRAVRTIGRLAIKLDKAADRCIKVLLQLIKDKTPGGGGAGGAAASSSGGGGAGDQNYLVQEAVVVIKDIFRRYPNHYEGVIGVLCEHLDALDEPEAKAALVWIIGEYAERIENAVELLEDFLESFAEETAQVQLALLTAVVKCYLKVPDDAEDAVQSVLQKATEESDNPDLRDRGYIYWRLLAADPDAARAVVLADKPVVTDDTNAVPESLLGDMLAQVGTLSSVYHKPPDAFVKRVRKPGEFGYEEEEDDEEDDEDEEEEEEDDEDSAAASSSSSSSSSAAAATGDDEDEDIFGLGADATSSAAAPAPAPAPAPASGDDLGDLFGAAPAPAPAPASAAAVGQSANSPAFAAPVVGETAGVAFHAVVTRDPTTGSPVLHLAVHNNGPTPVAAVGVRVNVNPFGLAPASLTASLDPPVQPSASGATSVALTFDGSKVNPAKPRDRLQLALREEATKASTKGHVALSYGALLDASEPLERGEYLAQFRACGDSEVAEMMRGVPNADAEAVKARLEAAGVRFVAQRSSDGRLMLYYSARGAGAGSAGAETLFYELTHKPGVDACKLCVRATDAQVAKDAHEAAKSVIMQA